MNFDDLNAIFVVESFRNAQKRPQTASGWFRPLALTCSSFAAIASVYLVISLSSSESSSGAQTIVDLDTNLYTGMPDPLQVNFALDFVRFIFPDNLS